MTPDLVTVDVAGALESAAGAGTGLSSSQLDALVAAGRRVHDDLLLARARGQVGFGDLYMLGREAIRAREAAESLASRFDSVAFLAQGAEADVAASILGALAHPFHNLLPRAGRAGRPRVVLVDAIDPDSLGAFLDAFAVEQTLLVVMSKRGSDIGPLVQLGVVRDLLKKRLGPGFQDHLVVVTDAKGGTLREEALREGLLSFEVPANVPARFSALTPVGLLPAAMAGIDVRGVLAGAHAAAERTAGEDLRTNPAYLIASVLHLLAAERGRHVHVFAACSSALGPMAVQLSRLYAESMDRRAPDGEPTAGARVAPVALSLPRDEALLGRLCASGRGDMAVVLLDVARSSRDRPLPKDGAGLAALAGKSMSDVVIGEGDAVRRYLAAAGVPSLTIRLPALTPNGIGALHMTSMLSAAFAAGLRGIDLSAPSGADDLRRGVEERLREPPPAP
jgi:glucose-6-phosphate isomerase